MSDESSDGGLPDMYAQQPNRGMLGCVLVPAAALFAVFLAGVVAVAGLIAFGGLIALRGTGTGKGMPLGPAIGSLVILALLAAFFGTVSRRLLAAIRGKPVPHLLPPIVVVVLCLLVGVGGLAAGVMAIVSAGAGGSARGVGVSVVFLVYGVHQARLLWRKRREAALATTP